MTETPETDPRSADPGDDRAEATDALITDAAASYSADGQRDDETTESVEGDREPHGPV